MHFRKFERNAWTSKSNRTAMRAQIQKLAIYFRKYRHNVSHSSKNAIVYVWSYTLDRNNMH